MTQQENGQVGGRMPAGAIPDAKSLRILLEMI
jgi:hypothetical protein